MRVAVLYGGNGYEREISLRSGEEVARSLEGAGHTVVPFEVDTMEQFIQDLYLYRADIFFIALHGSWGEDGRIQALLEGAGIPFTGSSCCSCSLAMDKWRSKILFKAYGVPVPPALLVNRKGPLPDFSALQLQDSGKVVVKPNSCGSTLGVAVVDINDSKKLEEALAHAFKYDDSILVEKYIPGRELTVTVVGNGSGLRTLPVVEIVPSSGFYSYDAKYTAGKTRYIAPAKLDSIAETSVKEVSVRSFVSLGCSVYGRVDIRFDDEGTPFVLEVNTVPGMTATSLVPKAAKAEGSTFSSFLNEIIRLSLAD